MIYHPPLAIVGFILLLLEAYLGVRYIRAGFPKTWVWRLLLFCCGSGFSTCVGLALVPEPKVVFQNIGAFVALLVCILLGGIVGAYTAPRYAQLAKRNRDKGQHRV